MNDRMPIPKTVEVTLRRKDLAPACPEVKTCLLEVVREPQPELLDIKDTGLPSQLTNGTTTVQLVRAEMLTSGHSCHRDYTVKAGLINAGGAIADGEGRIRTTTVRTVRVYSSSLSVISDNTATTTAVAPLDAEIGTTVDTHTVIYGDGTETTTTTTITTSKDRWERRLRGCVSPDVVFLPESPAHLLSARYRDSRTGEAVAVITWQDKDANWHVLAERRGAITSAPLHLQFSPSDDDLHVSAALSDNLMSLFVMVSRRPAAEHVGAYYHYTWGKYTEQWDLYAQGQVPKPFTTNSTMPYYVDRAGDVVGYWATESDAQVDQRTEDGACSAPLAFPGESWTRYTDRYTAVWGGAWNIITGMYSAGATRRKGLSVGDGDLVAVEENLISNWTHVTSYSYYSWDSVWEGSTGSFPRSQEATLDSALHFSLVAGSSTLAGVEDYGERLAFVGHYECDVQILQDPESPFGFGYFGQTRMFFDSYTYESGVTWATVTPGGWVTRGVAITERVGTDFSTITEDFAAHTNSWLPSCPDILSYFEGHRTNDVSMASSDIIYPVNLGACHSITASFNAFDQESGDWYCGAQIKSAADSTPEWFVYLNGKEVTVEVAACCGRPIEQFCAIYWRA